MKDRRDPEVLFSKLTEDQGIFKSGTVEVSLGLTPLRRTNARGDLICAGFMDNTEVEIVIPGRRARSFRPLEDALKSFVSKNNEQAVRKGRPLPTPITLRYPIQAAGIWRTRLIEKSEDEVERRYQFMAAQWTFRDAGGQTQVSGEAPVTK